MKYLIVLLSILLFASCSSSDDVDDRFIGTMEAKINGERVVFYDAWGDGHYNLDLQCIEPFQRIFGTWEGNTPNGHRIVLNFSPSQGLGTYNPVASYSKWEEVIEPLWYNSATYYQNHIDVSSAPWVSVQ